MAEPNTIPPSTPPPTLLALGPLHVSADAVEGEEEGLRFFPPGYSAPEKKPKQKSKKKKKVSRQKLHHIGQQQNQQYYYKDTSLSNHFTSFQGKRAKEDDTQDSVPEEPSTEAEEPNEGETNGEGENADEEGEDGGSEEGDNGDEENGAGVDKATSPPPPTPH